MAKICWVVPRLRRDKFTGGIYCVLKHADGLARLGHEVSVFPLLPSPRPAWFGDLRAQVVKVDRFHQRKKDAGRTGVALESRVHALSGALLGVDPRLFPLPVRHGVLCERARQIPSEFDITVATSFETALPVFLHGRGEKFYFCQHFEPYFASEFDDPMYAEITARLSYGLPLKIIANSPWLQGQIEKESGRRPVLVGNAVEDIMFNGKREERQDHSLHVISYGGRGAEWKGFIDMAKGVALARARSKVKIEWSVFGACELNADNEIAPFTDLGFLSQSKLAAAYSRADVLLSASWYESFPLFPLEAMAAGLATITTQFGTEAYAHHLETAYVIPSRDPSAICAALLALASDAGLRSRLGQKGRAEASQHSWDAAVRRMERVLLKFGE